MFTRKPLFLLETESETEGTESDAPEAEETSATQPEPEGDEPSSDGDEPETFDAARALAKIKKANSEARTQRERAKAAEEKAQGLEPAKRDAALQRVARRLNLPDTEEVDSFLARLQGDTVDDLAEDAERLLSLLAPKDTKSTTRRPKEALRGGGDPEDEPEELDPGKLADRVVKARGY